MISTHISCVRSSDSPSKTTMPWFFNNFHLSKYVNSGSSAKVCKVRGRADMSIGSLYRHHRRVRFISGLLPTRTNLGSVLEYSYRQASLSPQACVNDAADACDQPQSLSSAYLHPHQDVAAPRNVCCCLIASSTMPDLQSVQPRSIMTSTRCLTRSAGLERHLQRADSDADSGPPQTSHSRRRHTQALGNTRPPESKPGEAAFIDIGLEASVQISTFVWPPEEIRASLNFLYACQPSPSSHNDAS